MTTAWPLTARDLVKASLMDARIIASGEEPEAEELADCIIRLNGMLKSWQGEANLFRDTEVSVPTVAATRSITLSAGIRDVSGVRHALTATNERPLAQWNRAQYLSLPNKVAAGNPTIYYLDRQSAAAVLYIWPVPATIQTLILDYSRVATTVTDASAVVDVPEEWQETVYTNLAVRCADLFGAQLSPLYIQRAERLYQQMLDSDRPDAYSFEPSGYCQYG